jgi:cytochrome oxidase assembly protein ShyY1
VPGRSGPRRILADVSRAAPAGEPAENPPEPEPEPDDGLEDADDLEDLDDLDELEDEEPGRRRLTRDDLHAPRWIAAHVGIAVIAVVFVFLGRWQWHAGHKVAPLSAQELTAWHTAEPVDQVIKPQTGLDGTEVGQAVDATGSYDATRQLLVPGRTLDGHAGYYVLAPLVTGPGQAIVINRGWLPADGSAQPAVPAPPSGRVTVIGWAAEPESATGTVNDNGIAQAQPTATASGSGEVAVISPPQLVNVWPYHLLDGYINATDARSEAGGLKAVPAPLPLHGTSWDMLNVGYAFQWCFFAIFLIWWYILHWRRDLRAETEAGFGQDGDGDGDGPDGSGADRDTGADTDAQLEIGASTGSGS